MELTTFSDSPTIHTHLPARYLQPELRLKAAERLLCLFVLPDAGTIWNYTLSTPSAVKRISISLFTIRNCRLWSLQMFKRLLSIPQPPCQVLLRPHPLLPPTVPLRICRRSEPRARKRPQMTSFMTSGRLRFAIQAPQIAQSALNQWRRGIAKTLFQGFPFSKRCSRLSSDTILR